MTSPVFYTQLSLVLTSLMISVIFYMAWKTLGEKPYALNWSVAFLASSTYWLLIMMPGLFANFELYWLTANVFGFILVTLGLRGHCQRTDCQYLPANLWPYTAIVYAGVVVTTVVWPHAGLSVSILPFFAALTLFLSATMILRQRDDPRPAEWAAAISMIVFGLGQSLVAFYLLSVGGGREVVLAQLYEHPSFMATPAGFVGMAMFVIFMLASDVSEEMKEVAVRDQLTGLFNRRGFGEMAAKAYATARRTNRPVSVIMAVIDHFKNVNDEFGHAAGDAALVHFAELLCDGRRGDDFAARMGGEEFAVVLPGTELEETMAIADDLCVRMAETPMIVDRRAVDMTASFGVATISNNDTCLTDVIVRADRALYRSKRAGRNRVDLESSQLMRALDGTLKSVAS